MTNKQGKLITMQELPDNSYAPLNLYKNKYQLIEYLQIHGQNSLNQHLPICQ